MTPGGGQVLIEVEDLKKHFPVRLGAYGERRASVCAVDGVSFTIFRGETLGLVGETGCGKSTTGFTLLQLHRPTSGRVRYEGRDLTQLSEKELRPLRQELQIIFQDPYSTLNPRMTVGAAIMEPMAAHGLHASKQAAHARLDELLSAVGLCRRHLKRYPHEFSGGQRQRVCIARALACNPRFIVCDEPISALDVSIQAQMINLLKDLQGQYDLTYLFIAHDLAVVRHMCDRIAVMYLGRLAELAPRARLFGSPQHPYTRALLSAVPIPNPELDRQRRRVILSGDVPSSINPPAGCRFHPRCPVAFDLCSQEAPEFRMVFPEHWVACHAVGRER
jgi:peptide/nickel transport system ATP-binding protein